MMKLFLIFFLLTAVNLFSQSERYTKGAENGYAWKSMETTSQFYSTSKETYLSSILERYRLTQEKHPEVSSLGCKEEINIIYESGKSSEISIKDVAIKIDEFYSDETNLIVPIIFAYCHTIKRLSGASDAELDEYKKQVMEFCKE